MTLNVPRPVPVIETPRLTLRGLTKADTGLVSLYTSDFRVAGMTSRIPHPNPPGSVELFMERVIADPAEGHVWAIDATRGFGVSLTGIIGVDGDQELGYWLAPFFWGLGIATEAAQAAITHSFAEGHDRLTAGVFKINPASRKVLEKCGFKLIGESTIHSIARDETMESWQFERLRDG